MARGLTVIEIKSFWLVTSFCKTAWSRYFATFLKESVHYIEPPCQVLQPHSFGTGDIAYFICHLTFQNHIVKGSSNFMEGSSSLNVLTLSGLVARYVVVMKILWFISWAELTMSSKGYVTLIMVAIHIKKPPCQV